MAGADVLDAPYSLEAEVLPDGRTVVLRSRAWVLEGDTAQLEAEMAELLEHAADRLTDRLHEHRAEAFHAHARWRVAS